MRTGTLFLLLSTSVGLYGCNTLVTKSNGNTGDINAFQAAVEAVDDAEVDKHVYTHYKVYDEPNESDFLFTNLQEECGSLFSTTATIKLDQALLKQRIQKVNANPTTESFIDKLFNNKNKKSQKTAKANTQEADLWCRIREGYGLPATEHPAVQHALEKYLKAPGYFDKIVRNARPYLYHIVAEIEKRGLPLEIALLPAIESVYEPLAVSHKNAAGIWQFVPGTARDFGLKQTAWYDGRRDVMASTQAALDYLQRLYGLFNDWYLALAAYNYGEGNLGKAIKRNLARGKPTDFWSLDLPRETRRYVPKLIALAKIIAQPEAYGIELTSIPNAPYLTQVKLEGQVDLKLAAQLAGLSSDDFRRLNACYRRNETPEGSHHVVLPIDKASMFKQRLAQVQTDATQLFAANDVNALFDQIKTRASQLVKTQIHKVVKGETLGHIAQRYNTSVTELRQLNQMSNNALQIGDLLKVPLAVADDKVALVEEIKEDQENVTEENLAEENLAKASHQVEAGETLWSIARRYEVQVATLKQLNQLEDEALQVGSVLKLPMSQQAQKKKKIIHTVKSGDNLWEIARNYHVSVDKLSQWNSLQNHESLQLGQKLTIWADG